MMKRFIIILAAVLCCAGAVQAQTVSLTLDRCRELALDNDSYLKNAKLDVSSSRSRRGEALAEYFPTVSASVMGFHSLKPMIDLGVTDILGKSDAAWNISNAWEEFAYSNGLPARYQTLKYGYGTGVSFTQPLYAGGRIVNGNRLAELGVKAADLQYGMKERETFDQVDGKYWTVVSLQEKKKVLASAMELLDTLRRDVGAALSAGLATESDLLQVRLKQSQLKSARLQLDGGLRLAKMDLFNAIGVEYAALSSCATPDVPYIDDFVLDSGTGPLESPERFRIPDEEMAASMEEMQLLEVQVEAKRLEKKMVLGETLPQVAFGGGYGYSHHIGEGKFNGTLFAMVSIPLSDWGKTAGKLQRYGNEVAKAENERAYLDSQLLLKARKMWIDLETSWEQIAVAGEAAALARDSYARQFASYEAGMSTMSELLQIQTELQDCEDAYAEACIAYRSGLDSYRRVQNHPKQ